ncbi:putative kinase-like protein TMKL1 isoform X2 [Dendrobium catenatum]|uniref:Kinase-like protein TMKL1 n=1 Tax=Dendrobium catenatum TaxID=906689 RepID=A0A2I0WPH1_9ASPA|nr:putative kinase-like protein TMKL1 isoform X2 [Dendrobium catenatum]PKU77557.1 Putative kinase-like protein TMKL1 [Dendrobium catenatum]
MEGHRNLRIILSIVSISFFLLVFSLLYFWFRRRRDIRSRSSSDGLEESEGFKLVKTDAEELVVFAGCEHLRTQDILDAPGEVVGKSSYGTLYRATIRIGAGATAVMLLRFIRPDCVGRTGDILMAIRLIGLLRHPNLVPLRALYVGPRGEKLFVYPFYAAGNLAQFLKGSAEPKRWKVIYEICLGIARGLDHLHNALQKPIIHGNLKSKNVLLGSNLRPHLSDFGLHLLLSPTAAQEMLEASANQGYKAPELIKMKEANMKTDIYSLGIILLEIITLKDAPSCRLSVFDSKICDTFSSNIIINGKKDQNSSNEALLRCYQVAISCCSTSPALRPDIKLVIRKLEEIGRF